jgi:hypothetical protein
MASPAWAKELRKIPCHYCKRSTGTVDHKIPRAHGGARGLDNCVPCCAICNVQKGTMSYEEYLRLSQLREKDIAACKSAKELKELCPRCGSKNPERKHSPKYSINQRNCSTCGFRYYVGSILRLLENEE